MSVNSIATAGYSPLKGEQLVLKYLVREPFTSIQNPPMIILLHGLASNELDLFRYALQFPPEFYVVAARAPYMLGEGKFAWYEADLSGGSPVINASQAEKSRLVLKLFINQLMERYKVDARRILMAGFSQGAIMTYSVGLTSPEKLSGIAVFSGRVLDEIIPFIKVSSSFSALRVFLSHGIADSVLPVDYARKARRLLVDKKIRLEYHEYDMGHEISADVVKDMLIWINRS